VAVEIAFAKTVGTDPNACATTDSITVEEGTEVTYCFEVTNSGEVTFTVHDLTDTQLGDLLVGFPYDLAPGASVFITASAVITADVVNSATWTAWVEAGGYMAEATDSASVTILPPAHLQVAHLAPFASDPGTAVTITLNGAPALTDFAYGDSTPYIDLDPGTYLVEVFPGGSATPAITAEVTLDSDMYYTAIATGDGVNQPLALLALVDDVTAPAAGNFKLRLGHLAPFAAGGATADVRLQDGTVILDDVDFGDVAPYLELAAGTYDLKITTPDGATTLIDPLPVTLPAGGILSAFATGEGVNQPLGVFALPSDAEGFFLPLFEGFNNFLPIVAKQE